MKRLLISSLVLSVFFFIKAQEVPKKANLIQIVTLDAIDDAYKNIGRILINEGYELEMADKDFYVITTKVTQKSYGMLAGGSI